MIRCTVTPQNRNGVILAQGGNQRGYALYLQSGKPTFAVLQNEKFFAGSAPNAPGGTSQLEARLEEDGAMTLALNEVIVAHRKTSGVFVIQSQDELSVGQDTLNAVSDYAALHPLRRNLRALK